MILKSLLLSCFILASLPKTDCNYSRKEGTAGKNSKSRFSTPEECLRECKENEPRKTCYYHFTFEHYPVLGAACNYCTPNYTNSISSNCQCILANGVERIALVANRMLPGPSVQVCEGDRIIADITNNMHGMETTVHWHGVFQNGSQYYDGVPSLTQCAIPQGNTFRYDFIAGNEGTHFWHSHVGLQKMDGLYGSLTIRGPKSKDPNGHLYEYDSSGHVILISDWMNLMATERFPGTLNIRPGQVPDSILINGKGQWRDPVSGNVTNTTSEVFTVKSGHTYRFRIIGAMCTVCPVEITIEGHICTVIASDGISVKPRNVTTITILSGERYDCVINANQRPGAYWIQVRGLGECGINRIQQTAILRYKEITSPPLSAEPTYDQALPVGVVLNPLNDSCTSNNPSAVCVTQLVNSNPVDRAITKEKPDFRFFLPFRFYRYTDEELYKPNTYNPFLIALNGKHVVSVIDNISFAFPPSPPLSQLSDLPPYTFCNGKNSTELCNGPVCECMNTYEIPLNAIFEGIIVDEMGVPNLTHPFHLHGGTFYVIGMGVLPKMTKISARAVRQYDSQYKLGRNLNRPIAKDTIAVPTNGYAILRFRASNPGFWLWHCHFNYHTAVGMDFVIRIGGPSDLPPVPKGFPKCGDWTPSRLTKKIPELVLSSSTECTRECTTAGKPKICYYYFTLEFYPVLGGACDLCTPNSSNAILSSCQCITANGVKRIILAVNRMFPGPTIYVCLGDKVIVDVENKMHGLETTIHWHGLFQNGTPWYDGVPRITQCPIPYGNTFRYQFIAGNRGTHFWHTHLALQKPDGLHGAFIVREPHSKDPNSGLYERDLPQNIIVLSDWRNTQGTERFPEAVGIPPNQFPQSLLINGKGQWTDPDSGIKTTSPSEVFIVSFGFAYRFRMINVFFSVCPAEITIEGHTMTMIATDGTPIKPRIVTTIIFLSGERYDFVINANKRPGAYWIQVRALGECINEKIQQTAILRYSGTSSKPNSAEPTYDQPLPHGVVFSSYNGNRTISRSDTLCVTDLESAVPVDRDILKAKPDIKFVIPFNFVKYTPDELYKPDTYKPFLSVSDSSPDFAAAVNGISFKFPPSPPLSQFHDISPDTFCSADNPPANCGTVYMCTNTYNITLNSIVEVTLVDTMGLPGLIHPFHLHGYDFKVISMGYLNVENITAENIQKYGSKFSPKRNVELPPSKDTLPVPLHGYVTIRFRANNPGWWMLHCHFSYHEVIGMLAVMQVGNSSDLPPRPPNFPVCGNFKPPITPFKT